MPTYEYECEECGHEFEIFQGITDKPLRRCPKCRKLKVRRLIGKGAGIIFKGSGFYITDSRGDHGHPSYEGGNGEAKTSKSDVNG